MLSRLANDSSSDENPLLTKILGKISALIRHIDSSMLVTQLGYQLASDALIFSDTETKDWEADVTLDTLREIAGRAQEISAGVMEGFREIKQEVYKVCGLRYPARGDIYITVAPSLSDSSVHERRHVPRLSPPRPDAL